MAPDPQRLAASVCSMTGVGVARATTAAGRLAIEVRSVNGRGLAAKFRLPPECQGFEGAFEQRVRGRCRRGTVTVSVDVEAADEAPATIDRAAFAAAAATLAELAETHGLPLGVADVLAVPGVLAVPARGRVSREPPPDVLALLDAALDAWQRHRVQEGAATVAVLLDNTAEIVRGAALVTERRPAVVGELRARLLARVNEFLALRGAAVEDREVIREVALIADRADVAEELDRLAAHCARLGDVLAAGGEVGRTCEFLGQELLREINTIGSKSADVEIAHAVVAMKTAADRIKEQAANLE